ncbi:2-dehydro-3-deoxygluconokinase [Peptococcaceae bacterium CEB3]|nr:2-dehydro-3-deoxygluconokinase [Peptococcaceae bacterium CEB3]
MPDVITLGETMVAFVPLLKGPLRHAALFTRTVAGAESNVAVGVARLGGSSGWISRLGNDEFGRHILSFIRGEGVDTSQVKFEAGAPTGIYFKELRNGAESKVAYYRQGSAASHLGPGDIEPSYFRGAKILHVSGISLALSSSCREAVHTAVSVAKKAGMLVSFDPNLRLKLWGIEEARQEVLALLPAVDIFLPGIEEGKILFEVEEASAIAQKAWEHGAGRVIVKEGAKGCLVADKERMVRIPGYAVKEVVDPIGAGDAFAAGFLTGVLKGWPDVQCARLGNAAGAHVVTVNGDVEGLPSLDEVMTLLNGVGTICR